MYGEMPGPDSPTLNPYLSQHNPMIDNEQAFGQEHGSAYLRAYVPPNITTGDEFHQQALYIDEPTYSEACIPAVDIIPHPGSSTDGQGTGKEVSVLCPCQENSIVASSPDWGASTIQVSVRNCHLYGNCNHDERRQKRQRQQHHQGMLRSFSDVAAEPPLAAASRNHPSLVENARRTPGMNDPEVDRMRFLRKRHMDQLSASMEQLDNKLQRMNKARMAAVKDSL